MIWAKVRQNESKSEKKIVNRWLRSSFVQHGYYLRITAWTLCDSKGYNCATKRWYSSDADWNGLRGKWVSTSRAHTHETRMIRFCTLLLYAIFWSFDQIKNVFHATQDFVVCQDGWYNKSCLCWFSFMPENANSTLKSLISQRKYFDPASNVVESIMMVCFIPSGFFLDCFLLLQSLHYV